MTTHRDATQRRSPDARLGIGAVIVCALVNLLPVWLPSWPPMQDAIAWAELLDIAGRYDDPQTLYNNVYAISSRPDPNTLLIRVAQMFGGSVDGLGWIRLWASVFTAGVPLALLWLCRSFGRSPWLALLGCPLVFGAPFSLGLLNFLVAIPLIITAVGLANRSAQDEALRWQVSLAILLAATWFVHAFGWLVATGLVIVVFVTRMRTFAEAARGWPLLSAAPLFAVWVWRLLVRRMSTVDGETLGSRDSLGLYWSEDHTLLQRFWIDAGDILRSTWPDALAWSLVGGLFIVALVHAHQSRTREPNARPAVALLAVVIVALASWALLPIGMHNLDVIGERVLLVALLLGTALPAWRWRQRVPVIWRTAACCVALAWPSYVSSEALRFDLSEMQPLAAVIQHMDSRTTLLRVERRLYNDTFIHGTTWYLPRAMHAVRNGGTGNQNFASMPYTAIQYQRDMKPPKASEGPITDELLDGFDYVLVHADRPPADLQKDRRFDLIAAKAPWWLYKK